MNIFGTYKVIYLQCPDGYPGCEVLHSRYQVSFTEEQNQMREKFNSIELKYDDVLKLWEPFYDEKRQALVEMKYNKFFKDKLEKKFACLVVKNTDELKEKLNKEISDMISTLIYDPEYYK